ncbi:MAG TPA: hypothetical protein VE152_14060 [Acidimicrobiales bacterium]|nr:hypothetical protein [Acidimicrobiales bacterium]
MTDAHDPHGTTGNATGLAGPAHHLGPFEAVRALRYEAPLPRVVPVRQHLDAPTEADPAGATHAALGPLRARVAPGMTVAVTAGSRGIADLVPVLRAAGEVLAEAGAEAFVVPAMGSHGRATAEGQVQLLAELGVTEASVGMPIRATMETVSLGRLPGGPEVHLGSHAAGADGILLVNRVKPHTDFHGAVESGLAKIAAIGLGKQRGAEAIHAHGAPNLARWVPEAAARVVATGKVLGGLAVVENAAHATARVALVEADQVGGAGEAKLLAEARDLMGRLPFDDLDVVVVNEMGKDKSGSGMDTNVLGRMMIRGSEEFDRPRIANVVVLDLTEASEGNAVGLGLADFVPFRVLEKLDLRAMYVNSMTAGIGGVQRGQIPIALPTDRDAVAAAVLSCGRAVPGQVRLLRMPDTLDTATLAVSESLLAEVEANDALEVVGPPTPLDFDDRGCLQAMEVVPATGMVDR